MTNSNQSQNASPREPGRPDPGALPVDNAAIVGGDPTVDRRVKLDKIRNELHVDPFGQRVDGLISLAAARAKFDTVADAAHKAAAAAKDATAPDTRPVVAVAGRIVLHRDIGKLVFITLRDATGDLQIAVSQKSVDETSMKLAKLADLSDIVVARGPIGTTKTGEITVWAAGDGAFSIASKSLTPPPEKWKGLTDSEQRYRKRYVDLWANPEVMQTLVARTKIIEEIRQFLRSRGFLEVETPMLQPLHGGAAARPFITHHNALDMKLYMRIAPELYLKRLLVGGFPKIFEINRNFRNEGISPRHNPEFTMLEAYEAFGSWETMADLVEEMVTTVAQNVLGTLEIQHKDEQGNVTKTINLKRPWRRVRMVDLVEERTGWKFEEVSLQWSSPKLLHLLIAGKVLAWQRTQMDYLSNSTEYLKKLYEERNALIDNAMKLIQSGVVTDKEKKMVELARTLDNLAQQRVQNVKESPDAEKKYEEYRTEFLNKSPAEQLVEVYEKQIESTLIDPCFVTHVPSVIIPLARENKENPFFADVYELAINGQEISPGYTELNDPDVQEKHLRHQVGDREEQQQIDEDFINALRVGMPPAGGIGLGIDRLVMMLTGAASIRDVILFPLMRPQA